MKRLFTNVLIIVLAVLLGMLLFLDKKQENRRAAHMVQLQNEARSYNQEIDDIRSELKKRESEIKRTSDVSGAIIGFVPTSAEDVSTIKNLTAGYRFTPLLILDCAMDEDTLKVVAREAVEEHYDLILAGITFDQEVVKTADSIQALLPEYGYNKEPAFFLRHSFDTKENLEVLLQHGFQRLVRYNDSLSSGVADSGVPYLSYGFIRSSSAYPNFISQVVDAHSYTIMTFDFQDIRSGAVKTADITDFLVKVDSQVSAGKMLFTDLSEAFDAVVEREGLSKRCQEEFEEYRVEQQKRIEELEKIISEIYSRLDDI